MSVSVKNSFLLQWVSSQIPPHLKTLHRGMFDRLHDGDWGGLKAAGVHSDFTPGVPGQHQSLQLEDAGHPASSEISQSSPQPILLVEHLSEGEIKQSLPY